ncbi:uncharacterized protein LOC105839773 [Monomorium pharaonis]|uniref:uncharacterized protein LOC105839773 n=1 Tax=Monomorium pharaonis TaxID=307658 RepID=UPI0017468DF2|nr:uncharacterized protein LOC105839773 [Monomorium pharaonis]
MHFIEEQYYKINRFLLLLLGIWPYQSSILAKAQRLFVFSFLVSGICVELAIFITHEFNTAVIIDVLSFIFPTLVTVIKYYYFYIKAETIKQLLECIQLDWNLLKDKHERKIVESYAENGRLVTVVVTSIATFMGLYLHHASSLLKIASYRIEHAIDTECVQQIAPLKREYVMYMRVMRAVNIQQKGLKFTNCLLSSFSGMYFILIILGAGAVSVYMFQVSSIFYKYTIFLIHFQILSYFRNKNLIIFQFLRNLQTNRDSREMFLILSMLVGHFLYMFLANNRAQDFSDHCNNVFFAA